MRWMIMKKTFPFFSSSSSSIVEYLSFYFFVCYILIMFFNSRIYFISSFEHRKKTANCDMMWNVWYVLRVGATIWHRRRDKKSIWGKIVVAEETYTKKKFRSFFPLQHFEMACHLIAEIIMWCTRWWQFVMGWLSGSGWLYLLNSMLTLNFELSCSFNNWLNLEFLRLGSLIIFWNSQTKQLLKLHSSFCYKIKKNLIFTRKIGISPQMDYVHPNNSMKPSTKLESLQKFHSIRLQWIL
jgi:hypothetical protein